jgi:hypothetical protein
MLVELNESELLTLKKMAHERMPLQKPQIKSVVQPSLNIEKWFAGVISKIKKMQTIDPNDDYSVRHRVEHVMQKNEKLMEFYSRTGLGKAQILQMNKAEITRAVELADARNAEDGFQVTRVAKQEAKQSMMPIHKFLITP